MIVFAGNTPSYHHAREPHQGIRFHADASQGDIFRPICKRVWRVDDAKFLADVMPRALESGADWTARARCSSTCRWTCSRSRLTSAWTPSRGGPSTVESSRPTTASPMPRACWHPRRARSIFAGNGVLLSEATENCVSWPSCSGSRWPRRSWAKASFPERHPLALGMTGIWGTAVANDGDARPRTSCWPIGTTFGEADCSSWDPRFTFAIPPSRLIQIDIDPQEIGKIYPVEVGLVGDAQATLTELIRQLRAPRADSSTTNRASPRLAQERAAWEAQ